MNHLPTLTTPRLILRPFTPSDAPVVRQLAGEWEVAATTANIPHPYEEGMAEEWISRQRENLARGEAVVFAITLKPDGPLVGAIGLAIDRTHHQAEMGYWIGKPYWNVGYCTEAAAQVLAYAFETLDLNRVYARHMTKNPASGRIMQKLGMTQEGTLRQSLFRFDRFEDAAIYAVLRDEWMVGAGTNGESGD